MHTLQKPGVDESAIHMMECKGLEVASLYKNVSECLIQRYIWKANQSLEYNVTCQKKAYHMIARAKGLICKYIELILKILTTNFLPVLWFIMKDSRNY